MRKAWFAAAAFILLLAACAQPAPTPTSTPIPPTLTPVPTAPPADPTGPTKEQIRFRSGHFDVAGELRLPGGGGRHPVIIMVHGSGPATRYGMLSNASMLDVFQRNGYAVFAWDKPGSGQSTGELDPASTTPQRAAILADAVEMLADHPAIDPARIGLWGLSQAGWVMPLALELTDSVAFMIVMSGGAEDSFEQTAFLYSRQFLSAGGSPEDVALAEQYGAQALKAAEYDEYREAMEILLEIPGLGAVVDLEMASEDEWQPVPRDSGGFYDPMDIVEHTTIPVLAFYGELDQQVDPIQGAAAYEAALKRAGNQNYRVVLFPDKGHVFVSAPEYLEILDHWLQHLSD
jgi:pimeloyl-ACP methyl ester carboxylesterase